MSVIPLLPIFHKFNRSFFENSLVIDFDPIVKVRWSDNRLKTTAGFYKRSMVSGNISSEIVLSKPILESLPLQDVQSTLCHEMIHAWIDRILKTNEIHGINFVNKMNEINSRQDFFQITIRHSFLVSRKELKYKGKCLHCGLIYMYRRRMKNIACKSCCNLFFNGNWNKKCLIVFEK
tara:strand:+ start:165 stop:695 length:531 start_codon:yes stop_codon:yes gene_type:complete